MLAVGLAFGINGGGDGADAPSASTEAQATTPLPAAGEAPPADSSQSVDATGDESLPPPDTPSIVDASPAIGDDAGGAPVPEIEPPLEEPVLTGFTVPIPDACVSEFAGHQPSATREYRNGIHEGLDFYEFASCVSLGLGSVVIAAKDGVIVRADLDYTDLTQAEYDAAEAAGFQGEEVLDWLRGRQVWIDHGAGVVTRYAHLSAIAAGIEVGDPVSAGDIIGFVGESGSPTSFHPVETDFHLHFEIRIGDCYLGEGLLPLEARQLYIEAFDLDG